MAFQTDTSIDFASDTGYQKYEATAGDVVFSGGSVSLNTGVTFGAVRTPELAANTWEGVRFVRATTVERGGYFHRFLMCFDSFTFATFPSFSTKKSDLWFPVANFASSFSELQNALTTQGMSRDELLRIFDYPEFGAGNALSILVGMFRPTGALTGNISQITVQYDIGIPVTAFVPSSTTGPPIEPDFPLQFSASQTVETSDLSKNYRRLARRSNVMNYAISASWPNKTKAERDTLVTWLESIKGVPFTWTPRGFVSARTWILSGDYSEVGIAKETANTTNFPGVYTISARLETFNG